MADLKLTREQLAKFLPDHQSIRAFEQLLDDVATTIPEAGDEANTNAGIAIAAANAALSAAAEVISQISQLLCAPPPKELQEPDDTDPRYQLGTMASQNADAVEITGGSMSLSSLSLSGQLTSTQSTGTAPFVVASTTKVSNLNVDLLDGADWSTPGPIGGGTPSSGAFTTVSATGQITSTLATGTAPLVVASTTKVANLNADLLDGADWASPAAIGSVSPSSGAFTTGAFSGQLTSTVSTGTAPMVISSTTKVTNLNVDLLDGGDWASPGAIGTTTPANATFVGLTATGTVNLGNTAATSAVVINGNNSGVGGGVFVTIRNGGSDVLVMGNKSAIAGGAYSSTPYIRGAGGGVAIEFEAGFKTNGNVGFYGTTPVAKPTVTGSRGGNAALASLLTALAGFGLITDSSTV